MCLHIKSRKLLQLKLYFCLTCFQGPAILQSNKQLDERQWYKIEVGRRMKEGYLKVDNDTLVKGRSPGRTRGLNIRSPIFFGDVNSN